jgi:hypothetical protein
MASQGEGIGWIGEPHNHLQPLEGLIWRQLGEQDMEVDIVWMVAQRIL